MSAATQPFVPADFEPPVELVHPRFHLVPLDVQHNVSDHHAWTSSTAHIHATPGWEHTTWPPRDGMSLAENRGDLERHARDFVERTGFTYTVLRPGTSEVLGCVYIYPVEDGEHDAQVRSWVRADVASLDPVLRAVVRHWLAEAWPFSHPRYAEPSGASVT